MANTLTWHYAAIMYQGNQLPARDVWYPGDLPLFEKHVFARGLNLDVFMTNHPAVDQFFQYSGGPARPPDVVDASGNPPPPPPPPPPPLPDVVPTDGGGSGGSAESLPHRWPGWKQDLLASIGAPGSAVSVDFLDQWDAHEGGSASYNPLNTTQPASGATDYNSVHVKNYPSAVVGLRATRDTLLNGYYPFIVEGFKSGDIRDFLHDPINVAGVERNMSTWGTNNGWIRGWVTGIGGSTGVTTGGGSTGSGSGSGGGSTGGGSGIGGGVGVTTGSLPSTLSAPPAVAHGWRRIMAALQRRPQQRDQIHNSLSTIERLVR